MFESLSLLQVIIISLAIITAYLVRGITGFGSGLIAIPILALFLPVTFVVPFIGLLDFIGAASHGLKHKKHISWSNILPLLPFSFLGVGIAIYLIHNLNPQALKQALAVFIMLYGIYSLVAKPLSKKASKLWVIPTGLVGGFVGALFGTGGPFYIIYLQLRHLDKTTFRASIALLFLIDGLGRITGYFLTDIYISETFIWVVVSLPIMALAMFVGGRIHTSLSQEDFKQGISLLLIICGIALLF